MVARWRIAQWRVGVQQEQHRMQPGDQFSAVPINSTEYYLLLEIPPLVLRDGRAQYLCLRSGGRRSQAFHAGQLSTGSFQSSKLQAIVPQIELPFAEERT